MNRRFHENLSIAPSALLLEAARRMDQVRRKLLLVVDKDRFVGLISIGDIQRAILKNVSLQEEIRTHLRNDIIVCRESDTPEWIRNEMLRCRAEFMPILDAEGHLSDLVFWEDLFGDEQQKVQKKALDYPVVIMAGGLGMRMRPLTNILPKPLLPYKNSSILEHIIEHFRQAGCRTFYLSLNYKASMIRHYLEQHTNLDVDIHYVEETMPLGTAGSLSLLKDKLERPFFVSNCDILVNQDLHEFAAYHQQHQNKLSVLAALKHQELPYGSIQTGENGRVLGLDEKPQMTFKVNSGIYLLEPECFDHITDNQVYHMTHLIQDLMDTNKPVGAFPVNEGDWTDLGDFKAYKSIVMGII